jgi:hypothetical protein
MVVVEGGALVIGGSEMETRTERDRRSICRECGRGSDAPHRPGCETGELRRTYREFDLGHLVGSLWGDRQ